ncbi:MAG: YraN family protein [Candidatus Jacksonbacteria bacterium]
MNRYRKNLGDYGEKLAVKFLQKRGYAIIDQNFSSRYGEIDIIALHPKETDTICCMEVKTRISTDFGSPEEAVTYNKIKRLHDTACSYFFQNRIEDKIFRLDIIAIFINQIIKKAKIKHIKGIGYEDL